MIAFMRGTDTMKESERAFGGGGYVKDVDHARTAVFQHQVLLKQHIDWNFVCRLENATPAAAAARLSRPLGEAHGDVFQLGSVGEFERASDLMHLSAASECELTATIGACENEVKNFSSDCA
jgi:hypothetical protein